jgi:5-deoxy-glucuronate isomerase
MSELHLKPKAGSGAVHAVTPQSAGWTYVGFDLFRLAPGETLARATGGREVCLVLVSGHAKVRAGGQDFGTVGGRMSPFEGPPHAVYVPAGTEFAVEAADDLEIALCSAPASPGGSARHLPPGTHATTTRGQGSNTRYVTNITPEGDGVAQSLLVVEVVTPGGNTSSYPPHKHDEDDLPRESYLEETYYHRLNPPQGFAFQRVYTDDRSLDAAMAVEDGDVVLVPKGYHPVATIHGYDSWYLNVMAGPTRTWKFHNAPEHEWMLK